MKTVPISGFLDKFQVVKDVRENLSPVPRSYNFASIKDEEELTKVENQSEKEIIFETKSRISEREVTERAHVALTKTESVLSVPSLSTFHCNIVLITNSKSC